jgi:hypothetical protein
MIMNNVQTPATAKAAKSPRAPKAATAKLAKPGKAPVTAKPKAEKPVKAVKAPKVAKPKVERDPGFKTTDALKEAAKRYTHDKEHKTAGGHVSVNNGDEIATKLIGKDLDTVYAAAAKALKEDEKDLRAKYKHLNPGMQRMNLGNRMRAAAK